MFIFKDTACHSKESFLKELDIFKELVNFSSEWLYWIDNDGKVKYISKGVKRITGYEPEEFVKDKNLLNKIIYSKYK